MAKRRKQEPRDILRGVTITLVAKKPGEKTREKDLVYEEALKAREQFIKAGWKVDLFQVGFNK